MSICLATKGVLCPRIRGGGFGNEVLVLTDTPMINVIEEEIVHVETELEVEVIEAIEVTANDVDIQVTVEEP